MSLTVALTAGSPGISCIWLGGVLLFSAEVISALKTEIFAPSAVVLGTSAGRAEFVGVVLLLFFPPDGDVVVGEFSLLLLVAMGEALAEALVEVGDSACSEGPHAARPREATARRTRAEARVVW